LVHAFVVGEHGDNMIPLWSSVRIFGRNEAQAVADVARLRGERVTARFPAEVDEHRTAVMEYLRQGKVREAFERVDQLPADLRVVLRPYITNLSGAKTTIATANVIVDLVRPLVEGREVVVCGQVRLDGELSDLHVPVGVPVVIDARGWTQVVPLELWADEAQLLARAAEGLSERIRDWLGVQADESAIKKKEKTKEIAS
jgi:malate dehydrogenase